MAILLKKGFVGMYKLECCLGHLRTYALCPKGSLNKKLDQDSELFRIYYRFAKMNLPRTQYARSRGQKR